MVDAGNFRRDDLAESPRRHDLHIGALHFSFDLPHDIIHQPREPEYDARLHVGRRILTDDALGDLDLHARQFRRAVDERIHRAADPRGDDAADELAVFVDDVERRSSAEIDDHHGSAVLSDGGDVVDDAVGADFRALSTRRLCSVFVPGPTRMGSMSRYPEHICDIV